MAITQTFNLNLIPSGAPIVIHCDQYDVGEGRLIAKLFKGDTEYTPGAGATVIVQGKKPDGHGFMYAATLSGNTVTMDLTEQMSIVAGRVCAQVVVDEGDDRTGTFVFFIDVQMSALPADTDMSRSDYQLVEELLETAQSISTNFPYIGANGNWWYYDVEAGEYVDSGVDASITIAVGTVSTLPAGSSATVTNSGSPTDAVFNFGIPKGDKGDTGAAGVGVPSGGSTGQVLKKKSGTDYDTEWGAAPGQGVPTGGTTGQILAKKSSTDYDTEWQNAPSVSDKADKVSSPTAGDFAGLDSSGNLTDSGKKASDFGDIKYSDAEGYVGYNRYKTTAVSGSKNNVTWTVNADNSITVNTGSGGASANTSIQLNPNFGDSPALKAGETYTISDGVQSHSDGTFIFLQMRDSSWANTSDTARTDGNVSYPATFTVQNNYVYPFAGIWIPSGANISNKTFYPMIIPSSLSGLNLPYQQYLNRNDELVSYKVNTMLGVHQLLNIVGTTTTSGNITFTVNTDSDGVKSVSFGGTTNAAAAGIDLTPANSTTKLFENGKSYKISTKNPMPTGTRLVVNCYKNGSYYKSLAYVEDGASKAYFTVPSDSTGEKVYVLIPTSGTVVPSTTIYPMVTLAEDTDDTVSPYAMTNRELTEVVTGTITANSNSYISVDVINSSLLKVGVVKQLNLRMTISNVSGDDSWIHVATLSYPPIIETLDSALVWDSLTGSSRTIPIKIATDGKVYSRAKIASFIITNMVYI